MSFRHVPPAAAPLAPSDLWNGVVGLLRPARALAALEQSLRDELGVEHVFLVSSGRAGLTLILRALRRLSDRRRVVVPGYTCFSVAAAVVKADLDVVPCDLELETLDFDYAQLERAIAATRRRCASCRRTCSACPPTWRGSARCAAGAACS